MVLKEILFSFVFPSRYVWRKTTKRGGSVMFDDIFKNDRNTARLKMPRPFKKCVR